MATDSFTKRLLHGWVLSMSLAMAGGAPAEVVLHGSGARLDGNMEITSSLGESRGGNLFHSFSVFNVQTGESAVFSGPDTIQNVISRVTGGTSSLIDGPVSLAIPGANFYFVNPNGVIFGESGSIDATGSVYLSTADVVRLADGGTYYADPASTSVLTTADPVAFGFLSASPAPIELNGPWLGAPYSASPVPPGKTFALVAGDIDIHDGAFGYAVILAPGATVSLASVASAGDAILGAGAVDVTGFATLGHIQLSGSSVISVTAGSWDLVDGSFLGVVGDGASGSIHIRGGQLTVSGGGLAAQTLGSVDGGVIDIAVRGDLVAQTDPVFGYPAVIIAGSGSSGVSGGEPVVGGSGAGGSINLDVVGNLVVSGGSFITSESYGPGAAGDIHIRAGGIEIQGEGPGGAFTGISADNYDVAAGPSMTITVGSLQVLNGGFVGTGNFGAGSGGDLSIVADSVLATGRGSKTLSLSNGTAGGNAGNLSLVTRTLELRDGARIDGTTIGFGAGGDMSVVATERISISGELSGIFSQTNATDAGNAGALSITTPLLLVEGGVIEASTLGNGNAGVVNVHVEDLQLSDGARIQSFSGGYDQNNNGALVAGNGAAGNVTVDATGSVTISGATASGYPSGLLAETRGAGAGGDVAVRAWDLSLSDGATISSSSLGSGLAGDVRIELGDSLTLRGGSIATQATTSDGGNITITAPRLIHLVNSSITTSVESGVGGGGNIFIDPQFMVLQNSQIVANAFGGPGGNINIIAGQLIADPATVISASSTLGIDGTVNIEAPDSDVSADLAVLPASFLDAARLMQAGCGAARAGLSSLVEVGRGGLPTDPDDYLPSLALDTTLRTGGFGTVPLSQSGRAISDLSTPVLLAFAASSECRR